MMVGALLLALLFSGCAALEDDVNSSNVGIRGSEERELKRCPRVDFSAPCGRDGRICFDCICLDGSWTCGFSDAELVDAAAQVPVEVRPTLCERSNLDGGSCRSRHEGVVCGDCQCVANSWVCGAAEIEAAILASTDNRPFLVQWCERTNFERRCKRRHEGRVCGDCTCTNRNWVCEPSEPTTPVVATVGGGEETTVPPPTTLCTDLPDFVFLGECSNAGQQCIELSYCPSWDANQGSCVPGQAQSGGCVCDGANWNCFQARLLCCLECEQQVLQDGSYCYNDGQQCPNDAENTDCWCQDNRWACVPRIIIVPETPTEAPPSGTPDCSDVLNNDGPCSEGQYCTRQSLCPQWDPNQGSCVPQYNTVGCSCESGEWLCLSPAVLCCAECDRQVLQDGEGCYNEGQQCPNDADNTDCYCQNERWACVPRIIVVPETPTLPAVATTEAPPSGTPDCRDLPDFGGRCTNDGQQCISSRVNCPYFEEGRCVDNLIEVPCTCFGEDWACAVLDCLPCVTCEAALLLDGEVCFNEGHQCPNDAENTDCWCQNNRWACVPRIIVLPETPTVPGGGVVIETTEAPPTTPECTSFAGFEVSGRCPTEDERCIFERINCPYWSTSELQCVPNIFEATCVCSGGAWRCALPGCLACECDVQYLQDGEFCANEGQECPNDSEGTDCSCQGGSWTCEPRIQTLPPIIGGGGSGGGVFEGRCADFDGFDGNFFPCSSTGSTCLLASGNCEVWDAELGQCSPGTAWEAQCSCNGSWVCDLIPRCAPCSCTDYYVEDQRICYGAGQVCRDQTDSTDCTCDGSSWSCA